MKMGEAFPSNYLSADDLGGQDHEVEIERYAIEEVGRDRERKLVLYFKGRRKAMVCNVTNGRTLSREFGKDLDDWRGQSIILYEALIDAFGESGVPALRVRIAKDVTRTPGTGPEPPAPVPDGDDDIPF